MAPKETTAKFNIGGRVYEVGLGLLWLNKDSLLADLYDDAYHEACEQQTDNNGVDEEDEVLEVKPIFLDRNSERFQYCLDYMQAGRRTIYIPPNISKLALLDDLEYYGIEAAPSDIVVEGRDSTTLDDIAALERQVQTMLDRIRNRKRKLESVN